MDCVQAQNLISAQIDREIDDPERIALDAHLAECETCRRLLAQTQLQDAELRAAFAPYRQSATTVADRAVAELRNVPQSAPSVIVPRTRWQWLPMLAAAAAGFLIAVVIFRPWQHGNDAQHADDRRSTVEKENHAGSELASQNSPSRDDSKSPTEPVAEKPVAQLAYASGTIEIRGPKDRNWRHMQTGEAIAVDTQVRTGGAARCEFRTLEGSLVRLNNQTELFFRSNRKLELGTGEIWTQVEKSEVAFEVHVPRDATSVTALGTQFDVLSRAIETFVTVAEGSTRVEGKGWHEIVNKGQKAKIVRGELAETARVPNLSVATSWVSEILKLKGNDDPELTSRMNDLLAQLGEGKVTYLPEKEILALGTHCVLPLTRFIESDRSLTDRFKRINAARILAKIAEPWSVPDMITLLGDRDAEVRFYAAKALERLTDGVTQNLTPEKWRDGSAEVRESAIKAWRTWWDENRENFPAPPFAKSPPRNEATK